MKYSYVYKIILQRFDEPTLHYIGIRSCDCVPDEDDYYGTPTTYKQFWNDKTYTRTKEILHVGSYDNDYEYLMKQEVKLIRECLNEYGYYELGGRCLNVNMNLSNQRDGIEKAKEKGVYKGRKASIDITKVFELKEQGLGASAIAKQLGIGRASVYRVAKN